MLGVGGLRRVAAAAATRHRPLSTAGGQPAVALRDGTSMPAAICGTYVGNAEGHTSPEDCPALVAAALEVGFQHFDSALMYMNEAELGAALKGADDIYVTTKIAHPDDPNRNHTACTYMEDPEADAVEGVLRNVESSVEKLDLGRPIDLVLIHWPGVFMSQDAAGAQ